MPCGSWMPFGVAFDDPVGVLPSMVGTTFLAFNRDPATQGLTDRVAVCGGRTRGRSKA